MKEECYVNVKYRELNKKNPALNRVVLVSCIAAYI
jgi:hypothetical protein